MTARNANPQRIAIVGSGCRFPGDANSPSKLWELLRDPYQLAKPIPTDRFSLDGFYQEKGQYHGHFNVREAYFLNGEGVPRRFDASFFGMSPAEAMCLDPQCRLLLETVYEALESAGLTIENLQGSDTAVYAGQMVSDYDQIMMRDSDDMVSTYHASGTSHAILSNRVSYFFDWHGPSMSIDTACSSSLVALHQAVQQLRTGYSRVAIAAGANLLLDPKCFIHLSSLNMLSPDGRSRMWDANANGYARGEGIAAVVLKTLDAALEDGDHIECIIRETGFAQDGKTQGITSPNHVAQANLIRDCYSRAGLNLDEPSHRPHFFECHGTGTLAGDAAEAEAISSAFFSQKADAKVDTRERAQRLLVGSIKSIIGHTEGTAGLAGILKASLALQNATFPPNLLFDQLNPRIVPFYDDLKLSVNCSPWSIIPQGGPRRASVNSFGFGGANVHAILESYEPADSALLPRAPSPVVFTPFVFSAFSKTSLIRNVERLNEYLQENSESVNLRDIAYTLHSRRTGFQVTMTLTASSVEEFGRKVALIEDNGKAVFKPVISRISRERISQSERPRFLGIFTGQGAQFARMGVELLQSSKAANQVIRRLESRLRKLPLGDRPQWSLEQELSKDASSSRIGEAAISQPLCTAIQILQVDLAHAAGIEFDAVIGHSSGEIAAAYAAGYLSAEDAICVAHYRGLHSQLASKANGKPGAMMAIGTSAADLRDLCNDPDFQGRICIAAVNSSTSVTVSGDEDAVLELKVIFEDEKRFVRLLHVDKAYHSNHMLPCSEAYLKSMDALDMHVDTGARSTWFSSVFDGEDMCGKHNLLKGEYWDKNMISPVMFEKALTSAYNSLGPFDCVIEVGPHPALQGPALQTIQELSSKVPMYTGLFQRNSSAVESVAAGFGNVWSCLGKDALNLQGYDRFMSEDAPCKFVKGLPTYAWDHEEYWNESRYAKAIRLRPGPVHELLGHMTPDSNEQDVRWRHVLKPIEIPWLLGHRLQNQIVFPAAGYVVTALEAAMALCKREHVQASLIELSSVDFARVLIFEDEESNVEVVTSLADIVRLGPSQIRGNFRYHASGRRTDSSLKLMATAQVHISLGESLDDALMIKGPKPHNLLKVRSKDFYAASRDLEYQWTGPFIALDKLERKLGAATGVLNIVESSSLLIHPALIDAAFQTILLAYSFPDDGQLWSIHVPGKINRLAINPSLCARECDAKKGKPLSFTSSHQPDSLQLIGDIDVFSSNPDMKYAIIQIEKFEGIPLARALAQDDKETFATVVWDVAAPDPQRIQTIAGSVSKAERQLAMLLERMAGFYMREFIREAPIDQESLTARQHKLLQFATEAISSAQAGQTPFWLPDWETDTYEELISVCQHVAHTIEIQTLRLAGESLCKTFEADRPSMEFDKSLAEEIYADAIGLRIGTRCLARTVKQHTHRYPHLSILQIGAETGVTTKSILSEIGSTFASYTITDVSSSPTLSTETWTKSHLHKMTFKTLNICQDPVVQGFSEQSYDLIVASPLLRSAPTIKEALLNVRRLLKPGGYLITLELIPTRSGVYPLILGTIPGMWQGTDESQALPPALTQPDWDELLQSSGFSVCKSSKPDTLEQSSIAPFTVLSSQCLDTKTIFLRSPLNNVSDVLFKSRSLIEDLVIIGGVSARVSQLVDQVVSLVGFRCGTIRAIKSLSELQQVQMSLQTTVLSLTELEDQIFQHLDNEQWEALKDITMTAGILLWITQGRRAENPFSNMMAGLMRSVIREVPTISYQMLDIEDSGRIDAQTVSEALLRLQAETIWQRQDNMSTSVENELVLDRDGQLMIPRLIVNEEMNNRHNSAKRSITEYVDRNQYNVRVLPTETQPGYELIRVSEPTFENRPRMESMEVTLTLLSAVRVTEFGCMYLKLRKQGVLGSHTISLSDKHELKADSPNDPIVEVDLNRFSEPLFFSMVVYHLLTSILLRGLNEGDTVLVFEPEPGFATVLASTARRSNIHVKFMIASVEDKPLLRSPDWLRIHPSTNSHVLSRLLPQRTSVFVDFAARQDSESIRSRIRSVLSAHCRMESTKTLFTAGTWTPSTLQACEIQDRLQNAAANAIDSLTEMSGVDNLALPIVRLGSQKETHDKPLPFSIINWTGASRIPVQMRPIDTQISFPDHKTYWFAGLSGGLGIGLCEWMARHGARHFVISSRNPQIDEAWSRAMHELGVVVKVASCDVTIRDQVIALHSEICSTMLPIGGVLQGSMILEDTAIRTMSVDNFLRGTRPKVEGSVHLNDLFQQNTLDFFVFFSSIVSVIGRPGQCNYSAANAFMTSLTEQRRRKGLAASIIHIGPIYGIGFAAQLETPIYSRAAFRSMAMIPTSERDFYQMFAEAVFAGRPGSSCDTIEIFSGARTIGKHDQDRPVWENEPVMSHFIRNFDGISQPTADNQSRVPLRTQLERANSRDQIFIVVRNAFLPKIYSLFQLDPTKVAKETLVGMRLDEMGIDSLLAVEIRGWFMKTLEVNIPVLKILSGIPIGDLITMASTNVPARLVPNLNLDSSADPKPHTGEPASLPEILRDPETDDISTSDIDERSNASIITLPTSDTSNEAGLIEPIHSTSYLRTLRLSFSQETFWFVWAFLNDKTSLNHTAWARITGKVRIPDFRKAVRSLVQRHEILRTCIIEQNGKPMQAIMSTGTLDLEVSQIQEKQDVFRVVESLQNQYVYDVARGRTLRCMLLSISPGEHYFVAGLHPLVADGLSFQSLIKGVQQLYGFHNNKGVDKVSQYSHYSEKQRADLAAGNFNGALRFWKAEMTQLPPPLPILTLSRATSRPALRTYENELATLRVSVETKRKIQVLCRRYRVTPFHFYLTVFRILLLRYSPVGEGEDVSIGVGDGNRIESETIDVIGPFVNFLALRLRTQSSAPFVHLLQHVRDKAYEALTYSKVPFQVLLNKLNVPRSITHTPIFQSFINYRQGLLKTTHFGEGNDELTLHSIEIGISKMAYDVTLEILDYGDGECVQTLVVRKDLYSQAEVQKLAKSYELLIGAFLTDPDLPLDGPNMFAPAEVQEALSFSRGPSRPSQWLETVVHRVDHVAQSQPDKIAVRCGRTSSTYGEILAHANAITAALAAANIATHLPVAVLLEPTSAWISSLLGIMRVGAVYLPLDLSLPSARLAAIVRDCQPSLILVDEDSRQYVNNLERPSMQVIDISCIERRDESTAISVAADDPAVLLYTSGSSGAPKGIVLKHEGLRNWTEFSVSNFDIGKEVVLQQTSPSFDLSLIQAFTALCFGGCLCIVPRHQRGDAAAVTQVILNQGVTFTGATPSEYAAWFSYGKEKLRSSAAWNTAICAGESVPISLLEQFISLEKKDLSVYNVYGPTETTFTSTATPVSLSTAHGPITAGCPLPNYSVYVVDDHLRPVPVGVQGEIYIGGSGVGLCYLNQPELTSTKFVPDIFDKPADKTRTWKNLHRSGDIGRWLEDGQLLLEGRIDTQIKLHGLRIDLAEVEHTLLDVAKDELAEAVVTARTLSPGSPEILVAHVVLARPGKTGLDAGTILSNLSRRIPRYMCPTALIPLAKMPMTTSGKLNRRLIAELPCSDRSLFGSGEEVEQSACLTDLEMQLKMIWKSVLGLRCDINTQTDFFHVGGSSLLLLSLVSSVRETFKCDIPLVRMFESSTLGAMAREIEYGVSEGNQANVIDWTKETALSPELLDTEIKAVHPLAYPSPKDKEKPKVIVLTGATGQLGRALLKTLIADPLVGHVHCIGVRHSHDRPEMAVLDKEKVTIYEGDLALSNLGLAEEVATIVFGAADAVIHNGADMSYLKTYASLRTTNLQSTKDLIGMIARHSTCKTLPFHYVSTVSVGNLITTSLANNPNLTELSSTADFDFDPPNAQLPEKGEIVFGPASVARYPPPTWVSSSDIAKTAHGYVATKWASEVFLQNLHEHYPEWPIVIHRPSLIARQTWSNQSEVVSGGRLEFIENLRRYSSLLRAIPKLQTIEDKDVSVSGAFNVVLLDNVVGEMVDALKESFTQVHKGKSAKAMRFFHHIGEVELRLDDLRALVASSNHDHSVQEMDVAEWAQKAGELGMHPTMVALFESIGAAKGRLVFPRLGR